MKYMMFVLLLFSFGCGDELTKKERKSVKHFGISKTRKDLKWISRDVTKAKNLAGVKSQRKEEVKIKVRPGTNIKEWSLVAYSDFKDGRMGFIDKGLYTMMYINAGANKKKIKDVKVGETFKLKSAGRLGVNVDLNSSFIKKVLEGKIVINSIKGH